MPRVGSTSSSHSQKRGLVLGGTGHLGSAVARELLAKGFGVTVVSRGTPTPNLMGLEVDFRVCQEQTAAALARLGDGHQLWVDAATPYPRFSHRSFPNSVSTITERATTRIREVIAGARLVGAELAHISSFTTIPELRRRSGSSAYNRMTHPYFEVKALCEREVLRAAAQGLRATVVNPTLCLGPGDCKTENRFFFAWLAAGANPVLLEHELNVIDVRDVARGLVRAVDAKRWGERVLLAGHNSTTGALYQRMAEFVGARAAPYPVPTDWAVRASQLAEMAWSATGVRAPLASIVPILFSEQRHISPSTTQRELGLELRPLDETLRDTVAWYRGLLASPPDASRWRQKQQ